MNFVSLQEIWAFYENYKKSQKSRKSSCFIRGKLNAILAQTDTDQLVAERIMTIEVKCYTDDIRTISCCTKKGRDRIATPIVTRLVTVGGVPGDKEAGVKRIIADQQLVGEIVVCSHTVPQSISTSSFPIALCGRY